MNPGCLFLSSYTSLENRIFMLRNTYHSQFEAKIRRVKWSLTNSTEIKHLIQGVGIMLQGIMVQNWNYAAELKLCCSKFFEKSYSEGLELCCSVYEKKRYSIIPTPLYLTSFGLYNFSGWGNIVILQSWESVTDFDVNLRVF